MSRITPLFASVICLAACVQASSGQRPSTNEGCRIEGRLYDLRTGIAVRKAMLSLGAPGATRMQSHVIESDPSGHFTLRDLEPGSYLVMVQAPGYAAPTSEARWVQICSGEEVTKLDLPLVSESAISGRVTDGEGRPVTNAKVTLLRNISFRFGERNLMPAGGGITDENGEYRVRNLRPGEYFVIAFPTEAGSGPMSGRSAAQRTAASLKTHVPTFYPATTDARTAAAIDVTPGESRTADVRLRPDPAYRIKGRLTTVSGEPPDQDMTVYLLAREHQVGGFTPLHQCLVRAGGARFEMNGVAAGTYSAVVINREADEGAQRTIEVGGSDITDLVLRVGAGLTVDGTVEVEGNEGRRVNGIAIRAEPLDELPMGGPRWTFARANGSFALGPLRTGRYGLSLQRIPPGLFLKSIWQGTTDVTDGVIEIRPEDSRSIRVVLAGDAVELQGTVYNDARKTVSDALVILVPRDRFYDRNLWYDGHSDPQGRFVIANVAPGDYSVYAWEKIRPGREEDPAVLHRFADRSLSISLAPSARKSADLRVVPAADTRDLQ